MLECSDVRSHQHEYATGSQKLTSSTQRLGRIREMLDDVEQRDRIKRPPVDREVLQGAGGNGQSAARTQLFGQRYAWLDTGHLPAPTLHRGQEHAGPAAHVEHPATR